MKENKQHRIVNNVHQEICKLNAHMSANDAVERCSVFTKVTNTMSQSKKTILSINK